MKNFSNFIQLVIMLRISPGSFLHNMDGLYSNFATDEVLITYNPSKQKGALEFLKKALLGLSY